MKKNFHPIACVTGIFLASCTLIGLWIAGPSEGVRPAVFSAEAPSALAPKSVPASEIVNPVARLTHRKFAHDLRRPRAPRHRSERPSSFSSEHESLTSATVHSIIHDDIHRPFVADAVFSSPLSGHPLQLLRPPSARAS